MSEAVSDARVTIDDVYSWERTQLVNFIKSRRKWVRDYEAAVDLALVAYVLLEMAGVSPLEHANEMIIKAKQEARP